VLKEYLNGNTELATNNDILNSFIYSGIPPGEQFDYVIPVNASGQWGTYWVHSHSGVSSSLHLVYNFFNKSSM
jgi:FtsP/CotA-like multicopper oxidase with cupredoxin domain